MPRNCVLRSNTARGVKVARALYSYAKPEIHAPEKMDDESKAELDRLIDIVKQQNASLKRKLLGKSDPELDPVGPEKEVKQSRRPINFQV